MKAKLTITPARGSSTNTELTIEEGQTLRQALEKAGVATDGFNFFVNNEPANLDEPVSVAVRAEAVAVTATERARGS